MPDHHIVLSGELGHDIMAFYHEPDTRMTVLQAVAAVLTAAADGKPATPAAGVEDWLVALFSVQNGVAFDGSGELLATRSGPGLGLFGTLHAMELIAAVPSALVRGTLVSTLTPPIPFQVAHTCTITSLSWRGGRHSWR